MLLSTPHSGFRTPQLTSPDPPGSVKYLSIDSSEVSRDSGLDFVKGVLVIAMIAYHAANFFILDATSKSLVVEIILDFVSGSWVFLSGLLVSSSYRKKFTGDPWVVSLRLWGRAAKVLTLFLVLNAVIYWYDLVPHPSAVLSLETIGKILWHGGGDLSSFEVLVGIGYMLLLAPVLLWARTWGPLVVGTLVSACVLAVMNGGRLPPNAWLVVCGLGGTLCGYLFTSGWLHTIRETVGGQTGSFTVALLGTAAYYALDLFFGYTRADIHVYLFGITSIFFVLYFCYTWVEPNGVLDHILRRLGRYSLICYIGQMGLLWGLYSWGRPYLPASYWFIVTIAAAIMVVCVNAIDYIFSRSKPLKGLYNAIFG
jgi:hypothetical protein